MKAILLLEIAILQFFAIYAMIYNPMLIEGKRGDVLFGALALAIPSLLVILHGLVKSRREEKDASRD